MFHDLASTTPRRVALLSLATFALAGCDREPELRAGEMLLPTPENAPPADASVITTDSIPSGLTAEALSQWREARDRLLAARASLRLGRQGTAGPELFGRIGDVNLDSEGNILVLDELNFELRIFSPDGAFVGQFGREGEGPMEFDSTPHAIEVLGDGRLLVASRTEIKQFSPVATGHEYVGRIDRFSRDLCLSSDDRLFLVRHDRDTGTIVHEIESADDSVLQSFGRGYQSEHWLFRNQLSDGVVGCLDDPMRVVFAFTERPIVRLYLAGEDDPAWTARLEDYQQPRWAGDRDGSAIRMLRGSPIEFVDKPHVLSERHLVVQTRRARLLSLHTRTYLVDVETGHGALISEDLPRIMRILPGHVIAGWNDPYPRVEVRELPDGATAGGPRS